MMNETAALKSGIPVVVLKAYGSSDGGVLNCIYYYSGLYICIRAFAICFCPSCGER